jgi:hypothetical protein
MWILWKSGRDMGHDILALHIGTGSVYTSVHMQRFPCFGITLQQTSHSLDKEYTP